MWYRNESKYIFEHVAAIYTYLYIYSYIIQNEKHFTNNTHGAFVTSALCYLITIIVRQMAIWCNYV